MNLRSMWTERKKTDQWSPGAVGEDKTLVYRYSTGALIG